MPLPGAPAGGPRKPQNLVEAMSDCEPVDGADPELAGRAGRHEHGRAAFAGAQVIKRLNRLGYCERGARAAAWHAEPKTEVAAASNDREAVRALRRLVDRP